MVENQLSVPNSLLRRLTEALERQSDEMADAPGEFSIPFRPYFRLGDTAHVIKADGEIDILVDAVGSLPNRRLDNGTLSSASSLAQDLTQLDMTTGELAQYRFSPMDLFHVEMTHPSTTIRQWRSDTTNWRLPPWKIMQGLTETDRAYYEVASQFWVFEDETPRLDFYRAVGVTVEMHLDFWGWRYHFRKVKERGQRLLRVNGWPSP